jgi:hypothetical protein
MKALYAGVDLDVPTVLVMVVIVAVWAFILPINVRDADRRRLPPNVIARVLFIFLYVILYLVLVAGIALGGDAIGNVVGPDFKTILNAVKGKEAWMAITVLAALHSIAFFRELENSLIIWLHSARHLNVDTLALANHFHECSFDPTAAEQQKNLNSLREFDVYVTNTTANVLHLEAVNAWRKTSSLIRALREWNDTAETSVLNRDDLKLLDQLENAHRRKTRLAMDIIRMLELVERGGVSSGAMSNLAGELTSASHQDRDQITEIESRLSEAMLGENEGSRTPVRMTAYELQHYLTKIESYFRVEYRYLLQQVAELAAKSIVFAGDEAPQRLEQMKSVGFGQLGRIERINFDRILWVFFAISLGGFLILFLGTGQMRGGNAELYARIALVMALAALVGAVCGSNRKIQMRPITPWTHYLIAGVIAAGMFVLVHGTAMMLRSIGEVAPAAIPQTPQPGFFDILPWAVSPFFLAVAICWLARLPHWPRIVGVSGGSAERIFDGLAICLVMLLAQVTALSLHLGLETSFGVMLKTRLAESGGNTLLFLLRPTNPSLLLGFLVGAVVVKDVRRAAHSQLTDSKALHEYARSEELARERQELIGPAEIRRKLAQSGSI